MNRAHAKSTVRYYILLVLIMFFLFFSNDFGLTDVQKTAIIMAVGIDREEETFIVTSQIAVPQSSKQGKQSETVQIVSRGKTVADAFREINAKTGWYPKLVFCHLILLGEKATEKNVFDALDFFLLDEYMSDNCLLAACDGSAKEMLNVTALVDPSGSVAMQKVLSAHAQRVGTVLPSTLREFSIGYFSDSKSSYLPLVKTQPQQEQIGGDGSENGGENEKNSGENPSDSQSGGEKSSDSQSGGKSSENSASSGAEGKQDKPVFSAGETALFVDGKRVEKLTEEETFAFNAVKNDLQLAAYSVDNGNGVCTLTIKQNAPKTEFSVGADGRATMNVSVTMSAGLLDYSRALPLEESKDVGDVPKGVFQAAEKLLESQIRTTFEKCRACGCDIFGLKENLQKHEHKRYDALKDSALKNAIANVSVTFHNVR